MKPKPLHIWPIAFLALLPLSWSQVASQETAKTLLGPRNVPLADGAEELSSGDAELGVKLTLQGLQIAQGKRELKTAHSNLCAGYLMMDKPRTALQHCNEALTIDPKFWRAYNNRALVYLRLERFEESEADVARGQSLRPSSNKLKETRGLLLDQTDPVVENIEIDERRSVPEGGDEADDHDY